MATYKPVLHLRERKDGTRLIMIRIIKDRKISHLSTGYYVSKSHWNDKKNEVRATHDMHTVYNAGIKKCIRDAEKIETDGDLSDRRYSSKIIKQKIRNKQTGTRIKTFADRLFKQKSDRLKVRSIIRYKTHMKKLYKYFDEDVTFEQITEAEAGKFVDWLFKEYKESTISRFLKTIKGIYTNAVEEEVIPSQASPFRKIKVSPKPTEKERLSIQEIGAIFNLKKLSGNTAVGRDIYLTEYYTSGSRVADILELKAGNVSKDRINFHTGKTNDYHSVKISPKLRTILNRYLSGLKKEDHVFPLMRGVKKENTERYYKILESKTSIVNNALKKIAQLAGIDKKITNHIARHSFADHLRKSGESLYVISKALTHASFRTTQVYLDSFDSEAVDSATDKLYNKKR